MVRNEKHKDPRIKGVVAIKNKGKRWYKSGFRGYPGLTNTALKISEYIPKSKIYVEPFAGLGRVAKFIKTDVMVLNDKSLYAFSELKKKFPKAIVKNNDFVEIIKSWDGINTVFLIDPPWAYDAYSDNDLTFCDRKPSEYYEKILEIIKYSPSHWFVCCQKDKNLKGFQKYYSKVISAHQSRKYGFGLAQTKIYSNKPFIRYHQTELFQKGDKTD